jgi:hypothetical protein
MMTPDANSQFTTVDVETDIGLERLILHPERTAVGEKNPLIPFARHSGPGDERQRKRDNCPEQSSTPIDHGVIAIKEIILRPDGANLRSHSIGDRETQEHEHEEQTREDHAERDLRPEHTGEHR